MNEFLMSSMSVLASLFDGSAGWAIVALALAVRLALLPLTLHLSRKMLANQRKIKALQPQADAIKARFKDDPRQMFAAISALYKGAGARLVDRSSIAGALAQWPVFALVYQAVSAAGSGKSSFLWIKSLASPDAALTGLVLALTALAAWYMPTAAADTAVLMTLVQVIVTALVVWQLASAVGLYWAASSAVGVLQSLILRHEQRRIPTTA